MAYIENIVIGKPIAEPQQMFALDENDWNRIEQEKTYYTDERFLSMYYSLNVCIYFLEIPLQDQYRIQK